MKVTHIFWSLGFGGIETMLVNIANAQAEAGSEVSVLIINELYEQSLVNSLDKRVNLVFLNRKKGGDNSLVYCKTESDFGKEQT